MKKILAGIICGLAFGIALAQTDGKSEVAVIPIKAVCSDMATITDFTEKNGEIPMIQMVGMVAIGKDAEWPGTEAPTIMFVNPKTFSWTIMSQVRPDVFCITASGIYMSPAGSAKTPKKPTADEGSENWLSVNRKNVIGIQ